MFQITVLWYKTGFWDFSYDADINSHYIQVFNLSTFFKSGYKNTNSETLNPSCGHSEELQPSSFICATSVNLSQLFGVFTQYTSPKLIRDILHFQRGKDG